MPNVPQMRSGLNLLTTPGAEVQDLPNGCWRLELPAGTARHYRVAQLDDYAGLPRSQFAWEPPLRLTCRLRASQEHLPGTWGVGFWNDPFSLALFRGAEALRVPVLPQAAWFFFASPPNYLSLRDDLPAQHGLAGVFQSPAWLPAFSLLAAPILPLLLVPAIGRLARRLTRPIVRQASAAIPGAVTTWRSYVIEWQTQRVCFWIDGNLVLESTLVPRGPLGLVLWVDNQYMAFPPNGRIRFGALACEEPVWLEVDGLNVV